MKLEFDRILTSRHRAILGVDGEHYGYECNDGWVSLLDAVLSVMSQQTTDAPIQVGQIKEKYGTLHLYYSGGDALTQGAVAFAEVVSAHVCEITGKPGRIGSKGGWIAVRCEALAKEQGYEPPKRQGPVYEPRCSITVPSGFQTLASLVAECIEKHIEQRGLNAKLKRITTEMHRLQVHVDGPDLEILGVVWCAGEIAVRMDPVTGALHVPQSKEAA